MKLFLSDPYAYALNNPLIFYDNLGLREWTTQRKGLSLSALVIGGSGQMLEFISNCEDGKRITKTFLLVGYGLTVGLEVQIWGNTEGYFGETKVFGEEPNPIYTGISVSGPSGGLGFMGGTVGSASLDFVSYSEVYGASTGKILGASIFNFEGQLYIPWETKVEDCCEVESVPTGKIAGGIERDLRYDGSEFSNSN